MDDANERDQRLADIANQIMEHLSRGEFADIEPLIHKHPQDANEIRELWEAMRLVNQVAVASQPFAREDGSPTATSGHSPAFHGRSTHLPPPPDDHEILEVLGCGGMGTVYLARQISLNRLVALKMLSRTTIPSAADLARFRTEAESAARLDHPAIVPIYHVGQIQAHPYFTMKYVAGTTLARQLANGPLASRPTATRLLPVCQAIQYAHERGVLHRDLKPSNILVDESGQPHVSDFGLAKRVESSDEIERGEGSHAASEPQLTLSGAILGTPGYMAPEQAAGKRGQLGPASDVYSLGAVLYHMLTGRPPFQAASAVETVLLAIEQDPLPPRLLNPRVDRELEMIVLKCLQKAPDLRYASAGALAQDLAAYLADEPTTARSGFFRQLFSRMFRETHHATVLTHWGSLWMWHSLVLLVTCLFTDGLQQIGVTSPWPYLTMWTVGLGIWAAIFWALRHRSGPVTFVERQIAHVWGSSMIAIAHLFLVEMILNLPVLTLSPILGIIAGMVFLVKAGTLTGKFYLQSAALFATGIAMAFLQRNQVPFGITLFGVVSAASYFFPGWKYFQGASTERSR